MGDLASTGRVHNLGSGIYMNATLNLHFPKDFFKNYARDKPCQIRAAVMAGMQCSAPDTTVLCHPDMPGLKAMGSRKAGAPDLTGAWGCGVCHGIVSGVIKTEIAKDLLDLYHYEGTMRTLNELVKAGVLPNP